MRSPLAAAGAPARRPCSPSAPVLLRRLRRPGRAGHPPANQGWSSSGRRPSTSRLTNQEGQGVSLASLRGKVVVLAPFLSLCQDECPLVTGAFIALQRDVRAAGMGNKVVFLEATVDPGRDTVARLAAYQKEFGADWDLWTGTPAAIAAFWKPFGVSYQIVPEEQPPKTGLVHRPAADLRRRPHRRLHPHRPRTGASASSTSARRTCRAGSTRS